MQKKQYLCKRITKKRLLFLLWRRGAVGGKQKCIVFEETKDPERGKHFYFSSAKVLLLFDICKFFRLFFRKKVDFYV